MSKSKKAAVMSPSFQSTADQFYDENQFEAYRHLGEHSVDDMLEALELPLGKPVEMADYIRDKLGPALKKEIDKKLGRTKEKQKGKAFKAGAKSAAASMEAD